MRLTKRTVWILSHAISKYRDEYPEMSDQEWEDKILAVEISKMPIELIKQKAAGNTGLMDVIMWLESLGLLIDGSPSFDKLTQRQIDRRVWELFKNGYEAKKIIR